MSASRSGNGLIQDQLLNLRWNHNPPKSWSLITATAQGTLERKWCLIQPLPIPREYHEIHRIPWADVMHIQPIFSPLTSTLVFSCTPRRFYTVNLALHVRPELPMMAKMAWLMLLLLPFQWRANIWICCRKSQAVYLATLTCKHIESEAEQLQMGDAISCGD